MTNEAIATDLINERNLRTLSLLNSLGGHVEDELGFATRRLFENHPGLANGNQGSVPLRMLESHGLIERKMSGKRTYSIELTEAGELVASRIASIFEDDDEFNFDEEPDEISNENLVRVLSDRLVRESDHAPCRGEILELTTRLNQISNDLDELDTGATTWVETYQKIRRAVDRG